MVAIVDDAAEYVKDGGAQIPARACIVLLFVFVVFSIDAVTDGANVG
jgi:hypothetical protein